MCTDVSFYLYAFCILALISWLLGEQFGL